MHDDNTERAASGRTTDEQLAGEDTREFLERLRTLPPWALSQVESRAGTLVQHELASLVRAITELADEERRAILYFLIADVGNLLARHTRACHYLAERQDELTP